MSLFVFESRLKDFIQPKEKFFETCISVKVPTGHIQSAIFI